jgi:hypothetical protein
MDACSAWPKEGVGLGVGEEGEKTGKADQNHVGWSLLPTTLSS